MKQEFAFAGIALVMIAGCAKRPDAIIPVDVPLATYQGLDCAQIKAEGAAENRRFADLAKIQNETATGDAVGVFLIGLPMGSAVGGDKEGSIAISKGRIQALESVRISKQCPTG